jgi:hypothetical protein
VVALDGSASAVKDDSSPLMSAKSSLTTTVLKEISFFSSFAVSMRFPAAFAL